MAWHLKRKTWAMQEKQPPGSPLNELRKRRTKGAGADIAIPFKFRRQFGIQQSRTQNPHIQIIGSYRLK